MIELLVLPVIGCLLILFFGLFMIIAAEIVLIASMLPAIFVGIVTLIMPMGIVVVFTRPSILSDFTVKIRDSVNAAV